MQYMSRRKAGEKRMRIRARRLRCTAGEPVCCQMWLCIWQASMAGGQAVGRLL